MYFNICIFYLLFNISTVPLNIPEDTDFTMSKTKGTPLSAIIDFVLFQKISLEFYLKIPNLELISFYRIQHSIKFSPYSVMQKYFLIKQNTVSSIKISSL